MASNRGGHRAYRNGQTWLGGRHRKRGCAGAAMMIVGTGIGALGLFSWGLLEAVRAVL